MRFAMQLSRLYSFHFRFQILSSSESPIKTQTNSFAFQIIEWKERNDFFLCFCLQLSHFPISKNDKFYLASTFLNQKKKKEKKKERNWGIVLELCRWQTVSDKVSLQHNVNSVRYQPSVSTEDVGAGVFEVTYSLTGISSSSSLSSFFSW